MLLQTELEEIVAEVRSRNQLYEQGVYGLPQAAQEIRAVKEQLADEDRRVRELVSQVGFVGWRGWLQPMEGHQAMPWNIIKP